MNASNVRYAEKIFSHLKKEQVRFRIVDKRWLLRGDIDIIVHKNDRRKFEHILSNNSFERSNWFPPRSRAYKQFKNGEFIHIGGHFGGYIGGFGGGLGSLGRQFMPTNVPKKDYYLSNSAQLFILLYKYATRKDNKKYIAYFDSLKKEKHNPQELLNYCIGAFSHPERVVLGVQSKASLDNIPLKLVLRIAKEINSKDKTNKRLKKLYKTFFPAPYVAFVGCNGTGKSTTVKAVEKVLDAQKISVGTSYQGRIHFRYLPINKLLRKMRPKTVGGGRTKTVNGKKIKTREMRTYKSLAIRLNAPKIFFFEYLIRYWKEIRPLRVKHDIVITDRSYIDVWASPNTVNWPCWIYYHLLPRPKNILLYNDVKTISKRRPDIEVEQIQCQLKEYERLSKYCVMKIKTSSPKALEPVIDWISKQL